MVITKRCLISACALSSSRNKAILFHKRLNFATLLIYIIKNCACACTKVFVILPPAVQCTCCTLLSHVVQVQYIVNQLHKGKSTDTISANHIVSRIRGFLVRPKRPRHDSPVNQNRKNDSNVCDACLWQHDIKCPSHCD